MAAPTLLRFASGGPTIKTEYIHDGNSTSGAAGVVQNIEPAAMDLYVMYRHADGDVTNAAPATTAQNLDAFDMVIMGAIDEILIASVCDRSKGPPSGGPFFRASL